MKNKINKIYKKNNKIASKKVNNLNRKENNNK